MEGVPRLPMLRSVLKTTPEKTDFSRKIKWVRHFLKGYYRLTRMSDIIRDDSSLMTANPRTLQRRPQQLHE